MERRLTPRGAKRRGELIAFATARFAANGYHPTSVAEIVDGLGVGKGVFYWYFSSKDELFGEILRTAQRSLRTAQQNAIGDEPDPVRRVELGVRASLAWSEQHRDLYTLVQFAATDERFAPLVGRGAQVAVRDTTRQVAEAIEVGRVRATDPEVCAHAIIGLTTYLASEFIHRRGRPAGEVADATVDFVLNGLLAGSDIPAGALASFRGA